MSELIKKQDAMRAVLQPYDFISDMKKALEEVPVITEQEIITNYSAAFLVKIKENAKQLIYEEEQWVRLSDVTEVINKCSKCLN